MSLGFGLNHYDGCASVTRCVGEVSVDCSIQETDGIGMGCFSRCRNTQAGDGVWQGQGVTLHLIFKIIVHNKLMVQGMQ